MKLLKAVERHQIPLVLFCALLIPAVVYRAHARDPFRATTFDRVVVYVTSPLQRAMLGGVGALSDAWFGYVDLVDARRSEGELRRELGRARRRLAELEVVEVENAHLLELLDLQDRNPDAELLAARVIGAGLGPSARVLRVDRGALDGVERGDPVLAGQGLVGRVLDVAWTTSDVQLVADPRMSVAVEALRTGARGRLEGRGGDASFSLELSEVLRSDDLEPGDRVITSGLGGTYPPGLPVGIVTRIFTREGVPHRFADVAPFVDFARLGAVDILRVVRPEQPLATPEPLLPPALRAEPGRVGPPDAGLEWPPAAAYDAGVAPPTPDGGRP